MPNIAQEWAADLDASGEPGSEMLAAYLGKLEAAGLHRRARLVRE